MGATVEVKHPETLQYMEGTVTRITDGSMYTVGEYFVVDSVTERCKHCIRSGFKNMIRIYNVLKLSVSTLSSPFPNNGNISLFSLKLLSLFNMQDGNCNKLSCNVFSV